MKVRNYQINELTRDPVQLLFLILGVFSVSMLLPFALAGINFVSWCIKNKPEGYAFPLFADLKITLYASIFFLVAESLVKRVFS